MGGNYGKIDFSQKMWKKMLFFYENTRIMGCPIFAKLSDFAWSPQPPKKSMDDP